MATGWHHFTKQYIRSTKLHHSTQSVAELIAKPAPREWLQDYLMWGPLEDTCTLVDGVRPQADVIVLQFLCCPVHGLGDKAPLWDLTLKRGEVNHETHQTEYATPLPA